MLTLCVEAPEPLVYCMLFPDMASDINSIPAMTQNVSLPLPSSLQAGPEGLCEGRSSIKRTASMLASDGDHRWLFDFLICEARVFIA
jgi:hypothetical protein